MRIKKSALIIFLILFLALASAGLIFALEVDYPEFGKVKAVPYLPDYVKYIYYAAIGISGFIALAMLIWAGLNYLTSTGQPEKIKNAKERITAVIAGLIILLASWLIINTINPQLTIVEMPDIEATIPEIDSGIYLCNKFVDFKAFWELTEKFHNIGTTSQEQSEIKNTLYILLDDIIKNCTTTLYTISQISPLSDKFYICIVPGIGKDSYQWDGGLFFEKTDYNGDHYIIMPHQELLSSENEKQYPPCYSPSKKFNSVVTFHLKPGDRDWKVALYQHENYNRDYDENPLTLEGAAPWETDIYHYNYPLYGFQPMSMNIEGNVVVLLSNQEKGENAIFMPGNYPNLLDNENLRNQICQAGTEWRECESVILGIDTIDLILGDIY